MPFPNLATAADLQAYTGRTVDDAAADMALRVASGAIRSYTRQTLSFTASETVVLEGGERALRLPQRPLVVTDAYPLTVIELGDGGGPDIAALEGRDFTRYGSELRRGWPYYAQHTRLMGWPFGRPLGIWTPRVQVTYSHGYTEIPQDIVGVCLDLAAATLSNPNRLRSEAVGGMSVTYTVETFGTGSLTQSHRALLRRYRQATFSVVLP